MKPQKWLAELPPVLIVVLVVASPKAFAGPVLPSKLESVATFTGDQRNGIASGVDFDCPPIYTLNVNDLTHDITPAGGTAGIRISRVCADGRKGSGGYVWNGDHGDRGGSDGTEVKVDFHGGSHEITTSGDGAHGIFANNRGGNGGDGQNVVGWLGVAFGGNGGAGGAGGPVNVTSDGSILTDGKAAYGIFAESRGGIGGDGGWAGTLFYGDGGDGGRGGSGGQVTIESHSSITTRGEAADGIFGQSLGGAGGDGGWGGATVGHGGGALGSGPGGVVKVTSYGVIDTYGRDADGIFAQSVGGFGGGGGTGVGAAAWGSSGNSVGDGDSVTVVNKGAITTEGEGANSIFAQSVGGGGGDGGGAGGLFSFGAEGSAGGNGGPVTVENYGNLKTTRIDASAIFAQSLGGGGGNGGGSYSLAGFALGGKGGLGGKSDLVDVDSGVVTIDTNGDRSHGIFAQSVGGGGGNGGQAVTVTLSADYSVGVAVGGGGGGGGDGSRVEVDSRSTITTKGLDAHGVFAQSVGGGGGNGGFTISGSGGGSIALAISYGGTGGSGGHGKDVFVTGTPTVTTSGDRSIGLFAQSVGGGGGSGGFSIAAAGGSGLGGGFSLGGKGGGGGDSGTVQIGSSSDGPLDCTIETDGDEAHGLFAQSVGGGGGNGGFSIAAGGGGLGAVAVSLGGKGGLGGKSKNVEVNSSGTIDTSGKSAIGLFAQSVGGGGGNGGFSIAGAGAGYGALSVGVGGSGGGGGDSEAVLVQSDSTITTKGYKAHGLLAQSVGGGGGNGSFSVSASGTGLGAWSLGIGGSGAGGGNSKSVEVTGSGTIDTSGYGAVGLFAQSVGGGGGNGGFSMSGAGAGEFAVAQDLGGSGGGGGSADTVLVDVGSNITTKGAEAYGIFAQSVGGGGGTGGFSISGSGAGAGSASFSVGGNGGDGGNSQKVTVDSPGTIVINTHGKGAIGLFAQSVGGGGGTGRFSISGSGAGTGAVTFNVGGAGGGGGDSGIVQIGSSIDHPLDCSITTRGDDAHGLFAQSVGGGGGNGGFSITGSGAGTGAGSVGIGGFGGDGGTSQSVTVASSGTIETSGNGGIGVFAQSVGGGGGAGRFSISGSGAGTYSGSFSLGGAGGGGGDGSLVSVNSSSKIVTQGADAYGMLIQSVGGGGGNGGFSITGSGAGTGAASFGIGGFGGGGGHGKSVTAISSGMIDTHGNGATGLLAQSVGGGGGSGGFSIAGSGAETFSGTFSLGGAGGLGGTGDSVTVKSHGDIATRGLLAYGILAQSVGGGGGSGGFSFAGGVTTQGGGFNYGVGGFGGFGGDGGKVDVYSYRLVETEKDGAHGILAQSVGGGGGAGGFSGSITAGTGNKPNVALSVGGAGGVAGDGGRLSLHNYAPVHTLGNAAYGLFAQSVGGGGGDGGGSFSAALGGTEGGWNGSVSIGGDGGAAGKAGEVNIYNEGDITTEGMKSHGLAVQSVGGGGGAGGFSATGALSIGTQPKDIAVGIGGFGGAGGDGCRIYVWNAGTITTQTGASGSGPQEALEVEDPRDGFGNGAMGILAQSIGGGGGSGGFSFAGSFAGPQAKNVSVSIGGWGGAGGKGMGVDVTNRGLIDTAAANSHAILAQSIGGGGGQGGASVAVDVGASTEKGANQNVAVAVGGAGGDGNTADLVKVDNRAGITTRGTSSHGIIAQSIGGSGGNGGYSLSLTLSLVGYRAEQPVDIAVAIGGGGGNGNYGGSVNVENIGTIDTHGDASSGIFAQSIGGGGGEGGDARAIAVDFDWRKWPDPAHDAKQWIQSVKGQLVRNLKDLLLTWYVAVGGKGGGASNGGPVTVVNQSDVTTRGAQSYGIFAQSVGGGGGSGGTADQGIDFEWFKIPERFHPYLEAVLELTPLRAMEDVQVVLGGSGGSSGHGKKVDVQNKSRIETLGDGSSAIFVQSVGGGGGVGGKGAAGLTAKFGMGGEGGAAGNGGDVEVVHDGQIETSGAEAGGVFAQSIGGGGGMAGKVGRGLFDFGVSLAYARPGGGGGDGGAVTVQSTGDITTRGTAANGIFAQSVGGGGGIVGDTGIGFGFAGSVGGPGSGGSVNVTHTGNITTLGGGSHGIVAQSAGGRDFGGPVDITLHGAISAEGENSSGIIAQSRGDTGGGNISVTIADGSSVLGGSWDGIDARETGVGIRIIDGADNTLTNAGSIAALSGTAILAGAGNDTVNNSGTVTGTVDLGAGLNAFNNEPGAVFETGETVHLGAGNTLNNAGTLSPGGSGTALSTTLTGNLVQSDVYPGILDMEIGGFEPGSFDFLEITVTASLTGGGINFSFLPDYDIASEILPGESKTLQFLDAGYLESFACTVSYEFFGSPPGFEYDVFPEDNGLVFQAVHTLSESSGAVPEPTTVALLGIGIGVGMAAGWLRKRRRANGSIR